MRTIMKRRGCLFGKSHKQLCKVVFVSKWEICNCQQRSWKRISTKPENYL